MNMARNGSIDHEQLAKAREAFMRDEIAPVIRSFGERPEDKAWKEHQMAWLYQAPVRIDDGLGRKS